MVIFLQCLCVARFRELSWHSQRLQLRQDPSCSRKRGVVLSLQAVIVRDSPLALLKVARPVADLELLHLGDLLLFRVSGLELMRKASSVWRIKPSASLQN